MALRQYTVYSTVEKPIVATWRQPVCAIPEKETARSDLSDLFLWAV